MIKIFASIILLFLAGCGKSVLSKLEGTWGVESLIIGGNDSTSAVKNQTCYQPMIFVGEDEDLSGGVSNIGHSYNGCGPEGVYRLSDDDKYLSIGFHDGLHFNVVGPFGLSANAPEWKITKLPSSQLWLEVNYNNMLCILKLEKF